VFQRVGDVSAAVLRMNELSSIVLF
jgi:hypothetical protein